MYHERHESSGESGGDRRWSWWSARDGFCYRGEQYVLVTSDQRVIVDSMEEKDDYDDGGEKDDDGERRETSLVEGRIASTISEEAAIVRESAAGVEDTPKAF
ncbi:uncharacterized protein BP5553_08596 [Venustampulla echinocandica]|uniref:Uncharacterized protein n=1 Tax=Venustampulla echinocandica TaxID=2656787 RepID=A0A370TEM8_9HELO|nr:uncharacterized protein BP5553_08596 [Venustampulla echinocandica]RDL33157.1 hypothetical protein BP5553_08596 [Venustampulla echinocandica]